MSDTGPADAFRPAYGQPVAVAEGVRRVTANNPSPFTFAGTNSYIIGAGRVAIVDPGPDDAAHVAALLAATAGETVTHILLTHRHRDHVGGLERLKAATGAPALASAREAMAADRADGPVDTRFVPDRVLADGDTVAGEGWRVETVATPGHAGDHIAFALAGSDILFSGDHIMGWSSSVIAPPDGSMADYMASLDRLIARPEDRYLPGHGDLITDGRARAAALKGHRLAREKSILDRLAAGDRTIAEIISALYGDTDPRLHGAAKWSVFAHLQDLVARGRVASDGPPRLDGSYRPL